jgi:hypothetical protein
MPKRGEVVEVIFTPWPYDAEGNDLDRIVLSGEDAWALYCLARAVDDKCSEETAAADRLAVALRDVR